ncbi:hypothetical protein LTR70_003844 [Exophiala xenobiotica]|uniref:Uncharacterized protein n=1 Tax=Lithohypha guttulata TaxID=1690604 RepID=A0ABR0KH13_9EURO|nr:hypothetical protein LTR24_003468 [Lithohypha guttulata]KAK5322163.1 hypothetical protein LTR70_003844 [Exophiala xenobiotica]
MTCLLPHRAPYVCKACRSTQTSRTILRTFASSSRRSASLREQLRERERSEGNKTKQSVSVAQRIGDAASKTFQRAQQATPQPSTVQPDGPVAQPAPPSQSTQSTHYVANPRQELRKIQEDALSILESDRIPDEAAVLDLLARAQLLANANALSNTPQTQTRTRTQTVSPTPQEETTGPLKQSSKSDLFGDLSEAPSSSPSSQPSAPKATSPTSTPHNSNTTTDQESHALQLAKTLYTLLEDPKLYISEPILTSYVTTICTLHLPQYLPKIFHLYAHKPIPKPNSYPIQYRTPWSRAPKYGVPPALVKTAMETAILAKDMPLCISIIDTTVATPSFQSAKFLRRAALPLSLAVSVVPLSYSLSTTAAATQLSWDPDTFFYMCIAGGTAYLGTMGALLFVTVTTWNDHHKRVRWVPGTGLAVRWLREDERYWFDRVAQGWGFEDENRHGEEGGAEWSGLREVCGRRWLEVDRSSLLPGML